MRNQPLFQVTNHHAEACGVPPQIDEQTFPGVYRSYFENQNGEQALFLYDYEQERGTLYMGDAGWEHPHDVVDGKVPGLMLNRPEQLWLSACWEASGALKAVREQIREELHRRSHRALHSARSQYNLSPADVFAPGNFQAGRDGWQP